MSVLVWVQARVEIQGCHWLACWLAGLLALQSRRPLPPPGRDPWRRRRGGRAEKPEPEPELVDPDLRLRFDPIYLDQLRVPAVPETETETDNSLPRIGSRPLGPPGGRLVLVLLAGCWKAWVFFCPRLSGEERTRDNEPVWIWLDECHFVHSFGTVRRHRWGVGGGGVFCQTCGAAEAASITCCWLFDK